MSDDQHHTAADPVVVGHYYQFRDGPSMPWVYLPPTRVSEVIELGFQVRRIDLARCTLDAVDVVAQAMDLLDVSHMPTTHSDHLMQVRIQACRLLEAAGEGKITRGAPKPQQNDRDAS